MIKLFLRPLHAVPGSYAAAAPGYASLGRRLRRPFIEKRVRVFVQPRIILCWTARKNNARRNIFDVKKSRKPIQNTSRLLQEINRCQKWSEEAGAQSCNGTSAFVCGKRRTSGVACCLWSNPFLVWPATCREEVVCIHTAKFLGLFLYQSLYSPFSLPPGSTWQCMSITVFMFVVCYATKSRFILSMAVGLTSNSSSVTDIYNLFCHCQVLTCHCPQMEY